MTSMTRRRRVVEARPDRVPVARVAYLDRAPLFTSWIAAVLGLVSLVHVLFPQRWHLLTAFTPVLPPAAKASAEAVIAVSGLLLLRVAAGLRKRKRAEWRIAVVLCGAMAVADLVRDERLIAEGITTIVLLVALLLARSQFTARADPRGRSFAVRVVGEAVTASVLYGLLLLYVPGHVAAGTSFWTRLREVLLSLVGLGGGLPIHDDLYGDVVHATLLTLGLVTIAAGMLLAVRPAEPVATLSPADESRLHDVLDRHGARDSLGYFALRRDKSVIWSSSGKAAITYRVVAGVALVSGDPIGDPEAWPGAIEAYRQLVEQYGWTPAVMGCSELGATVFRREYGLSALALGDEAILPLPGFSLSGRAMRGVRQACTRVERAGYRVTVRRARDIDPAELAKLRSAADSWRLDPVERGYSMALSRLGDAADPDCIVVTAERDGVLRGLLHFVPWGRDGISLDLMRRDREADNGLNEFMIVAVAQAGPDLGVTRMSLNFAVFRDALDRGERIGAGPVLRLWRRVLLIASRWWQIDTLFRFNAKFHPQWQPRFVSFPSMRDLPRIAFAALEAEAFIVRPPRMMRLLGRG
jgi:lysyl-tRNA synthetase class 2